MGMGPLQDHSWLAFDGEEKSMKAMDINIA
jgi:hypothetical protein